MNVFISIVSHGHAEIIKNLDCLSSLAQHFNVVIKCNKSGDAESLYSYTNGKNIILLDELYGLGFGKNNNYVFHYCLNNLKMKEEDYFIVLNPDVKIDLIDFQYLVHHMQEEQCLLGTINLYKDREKTIYDNAIRRFPGFVDFLCSFVLNKNNVIYDKENITSPTNVEWAAGSFLAFKVSFYKRLDGFSDKYFMYCEDIDICYRAYLHSVPVRYYPNVTAVHLAQHANRSVFSKHFIWHVTSISKFLLFKFLNKKVMK